MVPPLCTQLLGFLDVADANERRAQEMLRRLGRPVLEVPYEELIGEPSVAHEWWSTMLEFLGVARTDVELLSSDWRRQIVKTHNQTVDNYHQVHAALKQYKDGKFVALL